MKELLYLASPYSHPDAAVREARFQAVCQATAQLLRQGVMVFSPIAHSHPVAAYGLPTDWAFWRAYDMHYLRACSGLIVLMLDGWQESVGVRDEVAEMVRAGKPVRYLAWDEVAG